MKRPSLTALRQHFARNVATHSVWSVSEYRRRPPIPPEQRKNVKIAKEVDVIEVERVLWPFGYLDDTDEDEDDIYVDEDDEDQAEVKQDVEAIMKSMGLPTSFVSKRSHEQTEDEEEEKENFEPQQLERKRGKKAKKPVETNISAIYDAREIDCTVGMRPPSPELDSSPHPAMSDEEVVQKYWPQRYSLFGRFDEGIQMDPTGWFSVTPERIAKHIASRCGSNPLVIYDPFGGVGGNAIQFALAGHHVICGDISKERLAMAKHNAAIYNVEDYIDFVEGDYFQVAKGVRADVVFLSPPWGGPSYAHAESFEVDWMMAIDGKAVFDAALEVADNVIYYLPRNASLSSIARLVACNVSESMQEFEIEENWSGTKDGRNLGGLKAISVYFGPLFSEGRTHRTV
jgi:trimethylguanosine synthase